MARRAMIVHTSFKDIGLEEAQICFDRIEDGYLVVKPVTDPFKPRWCALVPNSIDDIYQDIVEEARRGNFRAHTKLYATESLAKYGTLGMFGRPYNPFKSKSALADTDNEHDINLAGREETIALKQEAKDISTLEDIPRDRVREEQARASSSSTRSTGILEIGIDTVEEDHNSSTQQEILECSRINRNPLGNGSTKDMDNATIIELCKEVSKVEAVCPYCTAMATVIFVYDTNPYGASLNDALKTMEIDRNALREHDKCFECGYVSMVLDTFCPQLHPQDEITLKPGRYHDYGTVRYPLTYKLHGGQDFDLVRGYEIIPDGTFGEPLQYLKQYDPDRVDTELIKDWLKYCKHNHADCGHSETLPNLRLKLQSKNFLLIDVEHYCLVLLDQDALATAEYFALSYVWEKGENTLKTKTTNIQWLMEDNALNPENSQSLIPETVRDAIRLTAALSVKYLWVDRFCIIQDDQRNKMHLIQAMDCIYANATLTIIAAGGTDARYGLRGVGPTSIPRQAIIGRRSNRQISGKPLRDENGRVVFDASSKENLFQFNELTMIRVSVDNRDVPGLEVGSEWSRRGWTFQEGILSERLLIFGEDGRFEWRCEGAEWQEEYGWEGEGITTGHPMRSGRLKPDRLFDKRFPDLTLWISLVNTYNSRQFTHEHDAHLALVGVLNSLSKSFKGGFLFGLPELFFHHALLWQPWHYMRQRDNSSNTDIGLPSWSWVRWEGDLDIDAISSAIFVMEVPDEDGDEIVHFLTSTIQPLSEIFKRKLDDNTLVEINPWVEQDQGPPEIENLPPGWSRHNYEDAFNGAARYGKLLETKRPSEQYTFRGHEFREGWRRGEPKTQVPKHYFTHESMPEIKFRLPIPLVEDDESSDSPLVWSPILEVHTLKASFMFGSKAHSAKGSGEGGIRPYCLTNGNNIVVGSLLPNCSVEDYEIEPGTPCELISLSSGTAADCGTELFWRMDNWQLPEGLELLDAMQTNIDPKKVYCYINVLWIEWVEGIAHRKGLGRVDLSAWLESHCESVDVQLG